MDTANTKTERRLPDSILKKAVFYGSEFGCKQEDFLEVIEAARLTPMAIVGGQVMYYLPGGTCELYWLSYDPKPRLTNEDWLSYCNRSAKECVEKFNAIVSNKDIEKDAIESFEFLEKQKQQGVDINKYKIFLVYFNDKETDIHTLTK